MDSLLQECSKFTDKTIFVSNWMRDYHLTKGWQCNDTCVIYNGVNLDHFKKREKIDNGKINLVTHHWSNNEMKGFDIYEGIDYFVGKNDKYTFTYIGRENGTFKNTDVIQPLFGRELGKMLSSYDVYISGSRWDPGPNHVLESLACEIPTYVHTDGGGAVEFAGKENSYDSIENLISIIESNRFTENKMSPVSWIECINLYEKSILL
jgi:glycosyltransferase involved in cell wall biosynthesis